MRSIAVLARFGFGLALLLAGTGARGDDEVRITSGVLHGIAGARPGVREFRGIPYAAPPIGALRWAPPQPPASWSGTRAADQFGNRCVQTNPFRDMLWRSSAESEDCLYLSVWTPAASAGERLPVMVWIHGGGFFSGASDEKRHEGSALAARGVVLVEINYRLGVLGFLAHPELTAESSHHASGNYGLLDQIAALQWVKREIAAFGGDPGAVTIFGESAGSFSVSALMATPLSEGLFARAIGQSGAYLASAPLTMLALPAAEQRGTALAQAVSAKSLADLRATPAATLVAAVGRDSTRFLPVVDGWVLPEDPWAVYAAGRQRRVPLLAGWNSAEIKTPPTTVAAFTSRLRQRFPSDFDAALALYPAGNDTEASGSAVAFASDGFIGYGTWKWIESQAASGAAVFRYLFDQRTPAASGQPAPGDPGAAHASDIEFVFDTLDSRPGVPWRAEDRAVAKTMGDYWTRFAKTGDPNGPGLPAWPAWTTGDSGRLLRINANAAAEAEQHRDRYRFLDRVEQERRKQ